MRACIAALAAFIALDGACADYQQADTELRGTWKVASMTFEGAPRLDEKLLASTWSFADGQVVIERTDGQKMRFAVSLASGTSPKSFTVTPAEPSRERGGTMIYERQQDRLRIAFFDSLEGRPAGFGPAPKLTVLNLLTAGAAANEKNAKATACELLRAAGVESLLGPNAQIDTRPMPDPATQCRFIQPGGSVALALMRASNRTALDKQREHERELARTRAGPTTVQDEPDLGPSAFSVHMSNDVTFWALKRDTVVAFAFRVPAAAHDALLAFVRRVLARI